MYVLMLKTGILDAGLYQAIAASLDEKAIKDFMNAETAKLAGCIEGWKIVRHSNLSWPAHLRTHGIQHDVPIDAVKHFYYYITEVPDIRFESPEHCWKSVDHQHEPAPNSVKAADGADWIVDVWCKHCGRSGSMRIDPKEIQW